MAKRQTVVGSCKTVHFRHVAKRLFVASKFFSPKMVIWALSLRFPQ